MQRDTWADLATFATIADQHSFTRAAALLGVSPSALSHVMRGLEARLGVRLLNRTTRSVAPTEAGEQLLARLRPAIVDLDVALSDLDARRDRPAGRVRVTAHRTAALHTVMPGMARFAAEYPDVQIELAIQDGFVDIVADHFDAGVRHEHVLEQDMVSVRLGEGHRVAFVASPAYIAQAGQPEAPRDLLRHRCLGYRYTSSGRLHPWRFERQGETIALDPPCAFVSNDVDVLLQAALDGMGVACVAEPQITALVEQGRLLRVLDDWCFTLPPNYLYYPSRRQMSAGLRAFIDAMRAA